MKTRRQQSCTPQAGVTFTRSIDDKRRIMAANDPTLGTGLHWVVLASVAAVLLLIALSLFLER
jgi:hypothetical protein